MYEMIESDGHDQSGYRKGTVSAVGLMVSDVAITLLKASRFPASPSWQRGSVFVERRVRS